MAKHPQQGHEVIASEGDQLRTSVPRGHAHAISRSVLLTRILDDRQARVIVLQAPAGHGKTTLLQQLQIGCEASGHVAGWISIDESDNDGRRFYANLRTLVSDMHKRAAPAAADVPPLNEDDFRSDWLIARVLEIGRPVRIILDDLHAISSPATLNVVRELIHNAPDGLQLVIASRALPDIGISRLVVSDQALILRTDDLCFSREETYAFFSEGSVALTDAEIEGIHRQTEGWPAALQLYRLALRNPAIRQSLHRIGEYRPRELAEYLFENVLSALSDDMREFLLRSSPMSRMSSELCDAVLQRSDSARMLAQIDKAGLFIRRTTADGQWFVYHALFRAFLEEQLDLAMPGSTPQISRTAAQWFRSQGDLEEAIAHYSAAGDHSDAADVLDEWSDRLIPDAHLVTVERWSDRIPFKELEGRPGLTVKIIWALVFLRHHQKMRPLMTLLERQRGLDFTAPRTADPAVVLAMVAILEDDLARAAKIVAGIDTLEPDPGPFRTFELSAVSNARGYAELAAGHFATAHDYLRRARELSAPSGTSFAWAYSIAKSSLACIAQGQLQEALVQLRTSMADPRMYADESVSQASLVSAHIMALYEANDLDAAETRFLRFHDIIANAAIHDYLVVAYIAMSRIHDLRGRPGKALELIDEADSICFASKWPRASSILNWERVRRELVGGDVSRALAIVDRGERDLKSPDDWLRFSEEVDGGGIGRLRVAVHAGRPDEALRIGGSLLEMAQLKGWVRRQIKLHILVALAHRSAQSEEQACFHLEEALKLAAPGGFVRTFADEGPALSSLIAAYARSGYTARAAQPQFFLALSEVMGVPTGSASPAGTHVSPGDGSLLHPLEPFTKKEARILELLVGYASNEEIAAKMYLSKDGVKYHIKNIYAKLAVNNRIQAIKIAKQMGIG
ncbi:MAG: hypothetical protein E6Q40_06975 [Cupriavidus sp.]|nr:MAG: hypothetical protein E6Q40_06975 [Cupriavidus sp.]